MTDNIDINKVECPRCGSRNIKEINPSSSSLKEFFCKDCPETFEKNYFQYEFFDNSYSWPAPEVQYKCHEDELDNFRKGKMKPEII